MAEFEIAWEAPEYEYREKGTSWYWVSIIVAATIVAFSVWQGNFLFGFFIVIAEMLFLVWGNRIPRMIHFRITGTAIEIGGDKSHAFKDFESMGVVPSDAGWVELVFIARAKFRTPFKIIFPSARLAELRDHMRTVLPEVPYEPTFLDTIEKLLRF